MNAFIKVFFAAAMILILASCQEEAEIIIDNPQFGIAFIQEIDNSGVMLSANVYRQGQSEILEHGFMIVSFPTIPNFGNSEVFSIEGKPSNTFQLTANHSMESGKFYNVVAFVKTQQGYVYSEEIRFKSEGSEGFIFERLEAPSPIYFGDTVTVFGSNLSHLIQNYDIFVSNKKAQVIEANNRYFKFLLPGPFNTNLDQPVYSFSMKVAGKSFQASIPLNIHSPIIYDDLKSYDFSDTVFIKGKYLSSETISLQIPSRPNQPNITNFIIKNDSIIAFILGGYFNQREPITNLTIRGIEIKNKRLFDINPTEIDPNQIIKLKNKNNNLFEIYGSNFNSSVNQGEIIFLNGNPTNIFSHEKRAETNKLFLKQNSSIFGRINEVSVFVYGQPSKNSVLIEQALPDIQIKQPEGIFNNNFNLQNNAKSFQGLKSKNIFTIFGTIFEFDTKTSQFIARIASNDFDLNGDILHYGNQNIFNLQHNEDILFISFYSYNELRPNFLKIDLNSRTSTILPRLPINLYQPRRVFSTDQYLYLEGGQLWESKGILGDLTKDRWRFNLSTEVWEKLPDADFDNLSPVFETVNKINNKNTVLEHAMSGLKVLRYNETSGKWVEETSFPIQISQYYDFIENNSEIVLMISSGVYVLNKISKEIKFYESETTQFQSQINTSLILNDDQKFLYFDKNRFFVEFDHSYIDHP